MKTQSWIFVAVVLWAAVANGAVISWSEAVVDSTSGDASPGTGLGDLAISTNGALIEAANFGSTTDVTVNTVPFSGVDFSEGESPSNLTIAYAEDFNATGTSTGGNIDVLTATWSRVASGVNPVSAALTGLMTGNLYEVQFMASFEGLGRSVTIDDGNGNTVNISTNSPHEIATGMFIADGPTQALTFTANQGTQFLSGYQLRAVPEPSALAMLLGLGGIALLGWMRRRRRSS